MLSIFFRTISPSPRVFFSPKPYLSRQNSDYCESFGKIIVMNRDRNNRGVYWRAKSSSSSVGSTNRGDNDGHSMSSSAASKDRSSHRGRPQLGRTSLENAVSNSSKHTQFSGAIVSSNERSSPPSSGGKDRSSHIGRQHGSSSTEREVDHQSSELTKCLPMNAVNNSSKLPQDSPIIVSSNEWPPLTSAGRSSHIGRQHGSTSTEREAGHQSSELPKCSLMEGSLHVHSGNADIPSMIGRPQHGLTSPDLVVGHQSSEHHKPLLVTGSLHQQGGYSRVAHSVSTNGSFKNERPQPGHSSSERVVSHYSSDRTESIVDTFDICKTKTGTPVKLNAPLLTKNREKRKELDRSVNSSQQSILRRGMVLLKNYISLNDQIKIIKTCRKLGVAPGGFYQPGYKDGSKMRLQMMCLGKNWEPQTRMYEDQRLIDGAEAPTIPDEFKKMVKQAIEESHDLIMKADPKVSNAKDILPCMCPDICIVNFYTMGGKLGLHQDRDESPESLRKGLPVVSFSIGDKAEFLYGDGRDVDQAEKVELESGDVLIFGGESRHIFHGVPYIVPDSAPRRLVEEAGLRPGRLNLTFREY